MLLMSKHYLPVIIIIIIIIASLSFLSTSSFTFSFFFFFFFTRRPFPFASCVKQPKISFSKKKKKKKKGMKKVWIISRHLKSCFLLYINSHIHSFIRNFFILCLVHFVFFSFQLPEIFHFPLSILPSFRI